MRTLLLGFVILSLFISGCANNQVLDDDVDEPSYTEADLAEGLEFSNKMEYWRNTLDVCISQNTDWTYSLDSNCFENMVDSSDTAVYEHFTMNGPSNDDTVIIEEFLNGLPIVNELNQDLYEQSLLDEDAGKAIYSSYHWWGVKTCYSGSSASNMQYAICMSAIPTGLVFPIGGAYMGALCATVDWLRDRCPSGTVCLYQTWAAGATWAGCP